MTRGRSENGFILALSVLLVLVLSISGMSFLHLDFLERKITLNNVDNHGAFYVANAGIERARDVLKIPIASLSWTTVLLGTYDGPDAGSSPDYPLDPAPAFSPLCACGPAPAHNCVTMPFGAGVDLPDNFVSDSTFDDGQYTVRAYNNAAAGETSTSDLDQVLTVRALGLVRGDQKLLEANVLAMSGLNLINCAASGPCPQINGNPTINAAPGREPIVGPNLVPVPTVPLTSPSNYYQISSNFIGSGKLLGSSGQVRTFTGTLTDNSYYFISGNATIQNVTANNVVIVSTGTLTVKTNSALSNAVLVGVQKVELQGKGTITAPFPYPAIVSGGDVTKSSGSATIFGTVYAGGTVDFNPVDKYGVVIGNQVKIQGSSKYVDDSNDPTYLKYYALMPGFTYPPELVITVTQAGSWKEKQ